jgi:hypothetical protein
MNASKPGGSIQGGYLPGPTAHGFVAQVGMLRLRMIVSYRSRPCSAQHDNGAGILKCELMTPAFDGTPSSAF